MTCLKVSCLVYKKVLHTAVSNTDENAELFHSFSDKEHPFQLRMRIDTIIVTTPVKYNLSTSVLVWERLFYLSPVPRPKKILSPLAYSLLEYYEHLSAVSSGGRGEVTVEQGRRLR